MMLTKVSDWRSRLDAVVDDYRHAGAVWGSRDCAMFSADCLLAQTGHDIAARFRGRYKTPRGALRVLRRLGYEAPAAVFAEILDEIPPSRAALGDVVVLEGAEPFPDAMGVVTGSRVHVLHPPHGLGTVPLQSAVRAFRV